MSAETRPNSAGRGYGGAWPKRAAAHLERVKREQEAAGWPGGPWCECEACRGTMNGIEDRCLNDLVLIRELIAAYVGAHGTGPAQMLLPGGFGAVQRADTVDHRRARRLFPIELQGSDAPGGSDHPSNLRAMAHSHHSRRADDKARRKG